MGGIGRGLGPGRMRVLGGIGGVVACGVAGVTVAASPKPAGAPLKPPVDPSAPLSAAAATPAAGAAAGTGGLVIPATPVCGAARSAGSGAQSPMQSASQLATDPALRAALAQLRTATTRAQKLAIMQALTPDQRMQVTALLRSRAAAAGATTRCRAGSPPASPSPDAGAGVGPMIEPQVVEGGPAQAPATTSYVS